jgi:hypothetical protein
VQYFQRRTIDEIRSSFSDAPDAGDADEGAVAATRIRAVHYGPQGYSSEDLGMEGFDDKLERALASTGGPGQPRLWLDIAGHDTRINEFLERVLGLPARLLADAHVRRTAVFECVLRYRSLRPS